MAVLKEWTKAIIGNDVFLYREAEDFFIAKFWQETFPSAKEIAGAALRGITLNPNTARPAGSLVKIYPTFLNMAGQKGIFKAGGRLGFWDSLNSISWSNIDDYADFTPDVETLAGNVTFAEVTGKISNILPMHEGFIIYATKSIVSILQDKSSSNQWMPMVLLKNSGVAYPRQSTASSDNSQHYAYTETGLFSITAKEASNVIPDVTDYLKKMQTPVYLRLLENRFLVLEMMDETFLDAQTLWTKIDLPTAAYTFNAGNAVAHGGDTSALSPIEAQVAGAYIASTGQYPALNSAVSVVYNARINKVRQIDDVIFNQVTVDIAKAYGNASPRMFYLRDVQDPFNPARLEPRNYIDITDFGYLFPNPSGYTVTQTQFTTTETTTTITGFPFITSFVGVNMFIAGGIGTVAGGLGAVVDPRFDDWKQGRVEQEPRLMTGITGGKPTITERDLSYDVFNQPASAIIAMQDAAWAEMDADYIAQLNYIRQYSSEWATPYADVRIITGTGTYTETYAVFKDNPNGGIDYSIESRTEYTTGGISTAGADDPRTDLTDRDLVVGRVWDSAYTLAIAPVGTVTYLDNTTVTLRTGFTQGRRSENDGGFEYKRDSQFLHGIATEVTITGGKRFIEAGSTSLTHRYQTDFPASFSKLEIISNSTKEQRNAQIQTELRIATVETDNIESQSVVATISGISYSGQDGNPVYISPAYSDINDPSSRVDYVPQPPLVFPPVSFLLQNGSIGALYPTMVGGYVYDTLLKKWGNLAQTYRLLLDYSPVNVSQQGVVTSERFSINGGAILTDGRVAKFDEYPVDSYIKWGKIGLSRHGVTQLANIKVNHVKKCRAAIQVQTSLDGEAVELALNTTIWPSAEADTQTEAFVRNTGRWHTVAVKGNYDIRYLEISGLPKGNR